jgi:hypothetical protein
MRAANELREKLWLGEVVVDGPDDVWKLGTTTPSLNMLLGLLTIIASYMLGSIIPGFRFLKCWLIVEST